MIIAVCGQKGSGKSTVARMLQIETKFEVRQFAETIKKVVCTLTGCSMDNLEDYHFKENEIVPHHLHPYCGEGKLPTYRALLQGIGDLFRAKNPDVFIHCTLRNAPRNFIISDCRLLNEARLVKEQGGIVVLIERDLPKGKDHHKSEMQVLDITPDYIIKNDGDLKVLRSKVERIVSKLRKYEGL